MSWLFQPCRGGRGKFRFGNVPTAFTQLSLGAAVMACSQPCCCLPKFVGQRRSRLQASAISPAAPAAAPNCQVSRAAAASVG